MEGGWVALRAGTDRREKLVAITEEGEAKLQEAEPAWERAQERMRSLLSDSVWQGLLSALPEVARRADDA
jgi:DNA-binding MarR family transcriptional regulator